MSEHPNKETLSRFATGDLPTETNRRVVRHLLAGCQECQAAARWQDHPESWTANAVVGKVLDRVHEVEGRLLKAQVEAPNLLEELAQHPPDRQLLLVRNSHRFESWSLCELLLEKAFDLGFRDPHGAVQHAELGLAVAESLSDSEHPPQLLHDIRGRALAYRANARRITSDFAGAAADLAAARKYLDGGSQDPREEAHYLFFLANLHFSKEQYGEARSLFSQSVHLYKQCGDKHNAGRSLCAAGSCWSAEGRVNDAKAALEQGVALLSPDRDPRMLIMAKHTLAIAHQEAGDLEPALALLEEIVPQYAAQGETMNLLRLRYLEGRLARGRGDLDRAERIFRELRHEYADKRIPYNAAGASLDLAGVLFSQGRLGEIRDLAIEAIQVCSELGMSREAMEALHLFQKAVEAQTVTLAFIQKAATYFAKAQSNPSLRFQPAT